MFEQEWLSFAFLLLVKLEILKVKIPPSLSLLVNGRHTVKQQEIEPFASPLCFSYRWVLGYGLIQIIILLRN